MQQQPGEVTNDGLLTCSLSLSLSLSLSAIRGAAECYYKDNYKWNIMPNTENSSQRILSIRILHPTWHIQDAMMPTYDIKHHEIEKNDEL